MNVVYKNSIYPIQPQHINGSALIGIDRDIVQLCQNNKGWVSFTAAEIGWSARKLAVVKGLQRAGKSYYLSTDYVRSQFATSPAVDSNEFIRLLEETKAVEKQQTEARQRAQLQKQQRPRSKTVVVPVYDSLVNNDPSLTYASA